MKDKLKILIVAFFVTSFIILLKMAPVQHTEWIQAEAFPVKIKCLTWDKARVELNIDGEKLASFMINQVCDEED